MQVSVLILFFFSNSLVRTRPVSLVAVVQLLVVVVAHNIAVHLTNVVYVFENEALCTLVLAQLGIANNFARQE